MSSIWRLLLRSRRHIWLRFRHGVSSFLDYGYPAGDANRFVGLVFTHFGKEVPYSKNWLFLSETLWYDRWQQILELQKDLQYLEIVTWNE